VLSQPAMAQVKPAAQIKERNFFIGTPAFATGGTSAGTAGPSWLLAEDS